MTLRLNSFIFILSILYSAPLKDADITEFIEWAINHECGKNLFKIIDKKE